MSIFKNKITTIAGQKERLSNVANVFKSLGTNVVQGKLLTPSVTANTGSKTVNKILQGMSSPVGLATTALAGAGIATGIKAVVVGGSAAATTTTAISKAKTVANTTKEASTVIKTAQNIPKPDLIKPSLPKTNSSNTVLGKTMNSTTTNPTKSASDNKVFTPTTIDKAKDLIKNNLPKNIDEVPITTISEIINTNLPTSNELTNKKTTKTATKTYKKQRPTTKKTNKTTKKTSKKQSKTNKKQSKTNKKQSKTKKKSSNKSYGTEAQYKKKGGKSVKYTKTGQPYILLSNGKARFIKKSD